MIAFIFFIIFSINCDDLTSNNKVSTLNAHIILEYAEGMIQDRKYYPQSIDFYGKILGEPFPELIDFIIEDSIFASDDICEIRPGYLDINNYYRFTLLNYSPLKVMISTSIGELHGKIEKPDTIKKLEVSVNDTLKIGDSITYTWTSSKADFYELYFLYYYKVDSKTNFKKIIDFTQESSFTYPPNLLKYNGIIKLFTINPINGPFPKTNRKGNMSGKGKGYLYYYNTESTYYTKEIIVGKGVPATEYNIENSKNISEKHISNLMKKELFKFLQINGSDR